jgi:hypothetical protein
MRDLGGDWRKWGLTKPDEMENRHGEARGPESPVCVSSVRAI